MSRWATDAAAPRPGLALRQRDAVGDDGEDVVEVVGDPSGEHTEALELLRVTYTFGQSTLLGLCALALGDVADDRDARRLALVGQRGAVGLRDEGGAVLAARDPLVRLGGSAPHVVGQDGVRLRRGEVEQRGADHRRGVVAVHPRPGLVGQQDLPVGVEEDALDRCRREGAKPLLARLQRAERVGSIRDVGDERDRRRGLVGDDDARRRDLEGELRPILAERLRVS